MNRELTLQIILENPPAGVDFGIQRGNGHHYSTTQKQRSVHHDLHFDCTITTKVDAHNLPDFAGAVVQGKPGSRFIYIDIGTSAGQPDSVWTRRLKVPLKGITTEMINELTGDFSMVLETKVPGTGKDGGPTCGTVKPFMGWYIAKSKSNGEQ